MGLVERLDRGFVGREGALVIILASGSPRRRVLLREAGIRFRVKSPPYVEKMEKGVSPKILVLRHARGKALSVPADGTILAADTVVYFGGKIIGKPRNLSDARKTLQALQGKWHAVWTGVAILEKKKGRARFLRNFAVKTRVRLRALSDSEIRAYFRRINPLDKAGAYAIQSKHSIIESVRGSVSNAIGLPMEKISKILN